MIVHRYKVVHGTSTEQLEKAVNFLLNSGWVLVGGMTCSPVMEFFQAMSYTIEE